MKQRSMSRSVSPPPGGRQDGEGLLQSPAIQRALAARRATLALAMEASTTPSGGVPAGPLPAPSAPTPSGEIAQPLDGGVSLAGVEGNSPATIPQQAIRQFLGAADRGGPTLVAQVPVPLENGFAALGDLGPDDDGDGTAPQASDAGTAPQASDTDRESEKTSDLALSGVVRIEI